MPLSKPDVRKRSRRVENEASLVALAKSDGAKRPNKISIVYLPIDQVRDYGRKLRRHSKKHYAKLKRSIELFGITRPILVDKDNVAVGGAAIWQVAKQMGMEEIPAVRLESLSPTEIRLYRIADNKLQMGEFEKDQLCLEFIEISAEIIELNCNLSIEDTGHDSQEVDEVTLPKSSVAADGSAAGGDGEDDEDLEPPVEPVTQPGDVWIVGDVHKVICGNSLEEETYTALMGEERAQMVIGDGPYNVPVKGHVSSRKSSKEFAFASGEMSREEFVTFQRQVFRHLVDFSIDGSIHYAFISWHYLCELLTAGRAEYDELKNVLVWMKTNCSRGFYRSQHEMIAVFKSGTAPHICTFGIEKGARWRSNVIVQAGCNSFGPTRDEDLADHVTVKPTSLFADLMRDCSRRGGIILDPFGGSGVTILAAHWTGRRARVIEIDPGYVDVAIRRAANRFGLKAVLLATGQTFEEVEAERLGFGEEDGDD